MLADVGGTFAVSDSCKGMMIAEGMSRIRPLHTLLMLRGFLSEASSLLRCRRSAVILVMAAMRLGTSFLLFYTKADKRFIGVTMIPASTLSLSRIALLRWARCRLVDLATAENSHSACFGYSSMTPERSSSSIAYTTGFWTPIRETAWGKAVYHCEGFRKSPSNVP